MPHSVDSQNIRSTVDHFVSSDAFHKQIGQIYDAWRGIGFDHATVRALEDEYTELILRPFKDSLRDRVNAAEGELNKMRTTVHSCSDRVHEISQELSLSPFKVDHSLPLIEQAKILTAKAESLEVKRGERMRNLLELIQTNQSLSQILGQPAHEISPNKVPSDVQLVEFAAANSKLKRERDTRFKRFHSLKAEIKALLNDLEREPSTPLEERMFLEDESLFSLTDESLAEVAEAKENLFTEKLELIELCKQLRDKCAAIRHRLKMDNTDLPEYLSLTTKNGPSVQKLLTDELAELEILKLQNLKKFIEELRGEIAVLQEKCFVDGESRRKFDLVSADFDEASLERHEIECDHLRAFYRQNQDLFTKITRREDVWLKKIELDEKENDPNRFNNRGGQMLRDQQEKAKIEHELKKLDTELAQKTEQWLKEKGTVFQVYGKDYMAFLNTQKTAYDAQQKQLKEDRKKAKDAPPAAGNKRKLEPAHTKDSVKAARTATGGGAGAGFVPRSPVPVRTADRNHD